MKDEFAKKIVSKTDPLLILRGLACIWVLVWHVEFPRYYLIIKNINFSFITFPSGMVALWIFFIVSGYLMGKVFIRGKYQLTRRGLVKFYVNRILKIVPLYYINILLLSFFVYPQVWNQNRDVLFKLFTFTANNFYKLANFNPPLWAISVEVQFYLLVPLIYFLVKKIPQKYKLFLTIFILILGDFVRHSIMIQNNIDTYAKYVQYIYTPLYTNLNFFLFGFMLNYVIKQFQRVQTKILLPILKYRFGITTILLVFLYLYGNYHSISFFSNKITNSQVLIYRLPVVTCLVIGLYIVLWECRVKSGHSKPGSQNIFSHLVRLADLSLGKIGFLSYGIYIWHRPIIDYFNLKNLYNTDIFTAMINIIVVLIFSVVISIISDLLITKPLLRFRFR